MLDNIANARVIPVSNIYTILSNLRGTFCEFAHHPRNERSKSGHTPSLVNMLYDDPIQVRCWKAYTISFLVPQTWWLTITGQSCQICTMLKLFIVAPFSPSSTILPLTLLYNTVDAFVSLLCEIPGITIPRKKTVPIVSLGKNNCFCVNYCTFICTRSTIFLVCSAGLANKLFDWLLGLVEATLICSTVFLSVKFDLNRSWNINA